MNGDQEEDDDGEADEDARRLVSLAVAVSGFMSLGLLDLSWPSWCCFTTRASLWAPPLTVDCKDGSVGGCRAGVIPGFAVGVGGIAVVFVDPDGVVDDLEDGGYWLCAWGFLLSSSVSPYLGGSALLVYTC